MTVDALQPEELPIVWDWLLGDVLAHFDDFGPKTFDEFVDYVNGSNDTIFFAFRNGKKLVGSVSLNTVDKFIHLVFAPDVRGTGVPVTAMRALLLVLWRLGLETVYAKYFVTNKRVPGFFRKLGAKTLGFDGHTTQGGVPVQYVKVSFDAPTTPDLQPVTS